MGNLLGGRDADDEEEELEQQRLSILKKWRPQGNDEQGLVSMKNKKRGERGDSDGENGSGSESEASGGSSSVGAQESEDSDADKGPMDADETKSEGSKGEGESSTEGSDDGQDKAIANRELGSSNQKLVVHMEYEPLLSLHEPLGKLLEEPAEIWAHQKHTKKQERAERAAMEDAINANRNKAKAVAEWMAEMGIEDCLLKEAASAVREEPDELRYALNASKRFEVDDREGVVRKTLLQGILDVMTSDIETVQEVLDKIVNFDADEDAIRQAVKDSGGELRLKSANGVLLIEHINVEAEMKQRRLMEKEQRMQARELRKKKGTKGTKLTLFSRTSATTDGTEEGEDEELSSSSEEDGVVAIKTTKGGQRTAQNKEAEKKALAFRRLQVQRKIEDFLWLYRNGQNLQKINNKGRRYNRRVFIDTTKRALVVQGASGPRFFPFINMKEVDVDTHTTKEGRVETLVICAMEKSGRIYKELTLAFPDQAKAHNFVNCLTLFSLALRAGAKA